MRSVFCGGHLEGHSAFYTEEASDSQREAIEFILNVELGEGQVELFGDILGIFDGQIGLEGNDLDLLVALDARRETDLLVLSVQDENREALRQEEFTDLLMRRPPNSARNEGACAWSRYLWMFIQDKGDIAGLIVYTKVLDDLDAVLHSAIDSGVRIYVGQDTDIRETLKDLAEGRRDKCDVLNQGAVGNFGLFHPHADAAVGLVDPDIDGLPESFALKTANKVRQVGEAKRVGADKDGLDFPRTYALG